MPIVTLASTDHQQPPGQTHPVVSTLDFLLLTTPGRIVLGAGIFLLLCVFSPPFRKAVAPIWRLLTGGLIFVTPGPWDSTFDHAAPERPEARPNFRGERYPRTAWAKMPGYQRMVIRYAVAGFLYALWRWPIPVMVVTFLSVATLTGRRLLRLVQDTAHARTAGEFTKGVMTVLSKRQDDPATFIAFPRVRVTLLAIAVDARITRTVRRIPAVGESLEHLLGRLAVPALRIPLHEDEAQVMVHLDAEMVDLSRVEAIKHLGQARLPEGPWEAVHHESQLVVKFAHPKRPPAVVYYDADANRAFAIDDVPIGQKAGGEWVTLPLKKKTPHGVMSATTGWCKTTTCNVFVAHTAGNGGLVYINDPKRVGFLHLAGLPNVIIRTTADGWAATNAEVLAEMERRYELIERFPQIKEDPELYFQPLFLINDERGSLVADLKEWAKKHGEKGLPTPLRYEKKILWQGRAAAIYEADFAQQANLQVFLDSDGRDQRMWRIASGPQTRSSWMMLFSGIAKKSAGTKKGRAMLGIGVDSVEEITLAQVSDMEARDFAEKGAAIAERENAWRQARLHALMESVPESAPVHSDSDDHPGITQPNAPVQSPRPGADEPETDNADNGLRNVYPLHGTIAEETTENGDQAEQDEDGPEDLIIGIKAGAMFLEMTEANFISARKRRPITGEVRRSRNGKDQPAWSCLDLREWRSQAPRAGAS